jgi:hypothetical protein
VVGLLVPLHFGLQGEVERARDHVNQGWCAASAVEMHCQHGIQKLAAVAPLVEERGPDELDCSLKSSTSG